MNITQNIGDIMKNLELNKNINEVMNGNNLYLSDNFFGNYGRK